MAGALVFSAPGTAVAQDGVTESASVARVGLLAEGVGMGDQPSDRVTRVQRVLDRRGYSLGAPGVDGRFGPLTASAVRRYQARNELAVDGIVGPRTRRSLAALAARQQRASQRRRAGDDRRRSSAAPGQRPSATSTTPDKAAAPEPSTTPRPAAAGSGRDRTAIVIALFAAIVSLIAITAVFRPRRGRPARRAQANVVAIARDLMLEGRSREPGIGDFRGFALASAVPDDAEPDQTRFLVDDPRKASPVWVSSGEVTRSTSDLPARSPVIGYVTVPPGSGDHDEQAFSDIEAFCQGHDWQLLEIVRDSEQTRMLERPGLSYALRQIAAGQANALVISDVRRLTRSMVDLGALLEWFREAHATLIALDLDLDTTTSHGDHVATTLITLSEWERERIAKRTRSGLARVKAEGHTAGRPAVADNPELLGRIAGMRERGMTLQGISDQLNNEGVPTLRGGAKWRPSSVQAALGYKRPGARHPKDQLPPTHPQEHQQQHQ